MLCLGAAVFLRKTTAHLPAPLRTFLNSTHLPVLLFQPIIHRDGEGELLANLLSEETPTNKVIMAAAAGSLVLFAAFCLCVVLKIDPAGGMRPNLHSAAAAVIGLIGGMPLVVFRVALWSDDMRSRISGLKELQEKEVAYFEPILSNLSTPQCLLVNLVEVLPTTVILLPAAQGGMSRSFNAYCIALVSALEPGAKVPAVSARVTFQLLAIFLLHIYHLALLVIEPSSQLHRFHPLYTPFSFPTGHPRVPGHHDHGLVRRDGPADQQQGEPERAGRGHRGHQQRRPLLQGQRALARGAGGAGRGPGGGEERGLDVLSVCEWILVFKLPFLPLCPSAEEKIEFRTLIC
jgi:hypothetical protein